MKLSESTTNVERVEQGAWIGEKYGTPIPEMGDLCLKVRGLNNKDYRKLQSKLMEGVPRRERVGGRLPPEQMDRITALCLRDTCLLDWANLEGDGEVGENGKPVPFSKEFSNALLTVPKYMRFREATIWAATMVGEQQDAEVDDDAGN